MKLNVQERLTLVRIIPEKGNFVTMSTVEKLREVLSLSEEEVIKYELKQTNETVKWNEAGIKPSEVKISEVGMALIVKTLEEMDKKEELTTGQYQIFKRIKEEQKE